MNGLNAIIKDGKVYEAVLTSNVISCDGCDFYIPIVTTECPYARMCLANACILRFSQSLTDNINEKRHSASPPQQPSRRRWRN